MNGTFRAMRPNMKDGIEADADYERDVLSLDFPHGREEFSLSYFREMLMIPFNVPKPQSGWKREFTEAEKVKLRPIAETLAMLDGNAFFGNDDNGRQWFEMYLPEAHALYESNGGDDGWAGQASFVKSKEQNR